MKRFIEKITGGYSSSARVVDGTLILSLPDAVSPVIWRMDLGHAKASAIEVREQDGEDGYFVLTLKTPKSDVHDIAPFATRSKAVSALMAVSRAMEQAQEKTGGRACATASHAVHDSVDSVSPSRMPAEKKHRKITHGQWAAGIIGLACLGFLINMIIGMGPQTGALVSSSNPLATTASRSASDAVGVPVSADDFLQGR